VVNEMKAPPVDAALIDRAVAILRRGGLVAVPTETVYGLAADASNPAAVRAIFAAKGRPADHPVIVHVGDGAALEDWAREVPEAARRLAAAFWPGPLTLVLKRAKSVDDVVTGGQDTIGLRAPAHPWARALLQAFGGALAAPSANRFGRISPTTAEHVRADLGEKPHGVVDLILDGGRCPVGIESTIVDLSSAAPTMLRPGAVTRAALEEVLGTTVGDAGADAPRASGRLESHYAPATPLEVVPVGLLRARISQLAGRRLAILAPPDLIAEVPGNVVAFLPAAAFPVRYAHELYAHLHVLDASGADRLLIAAPPPGPEWAAVADRLRRAQGGVG
jgi:L-threonylcarbamoyladenylate synthase